MILLLLLMIIYSVYELTSRLSKLIWTSDEYLQYMFVNNTEARRELLARQFQIQCA